MNDARNLAREILIKESRARNQESPAGQDQAEQAKPGKEGDNKKTGKKEKTPAKGKDKEKAGGKEKKPDKGEN